MATKKVGSSCQSIPIPMIESQALAFFLVSKKQVLIIDSRSLMEFNSQSIQNAINISSSKLLKRRLQQDKMAIRELVESTSSKQQVSLDPNTTVIVYDHCTEHVRHLSSDHFVYMLLRKLASHYCQVFMLKGGIVDFQTHYPNMCERRTILPLDLTPRVLPTSPPTPGIDTVDGGCSSTKSPPFLTALSVPTSNVGPTRILDHLYLGSQADAMDADVLRANGVTHILNVSSNPKTPHVLDTFFYRIEVNDGYVDNFLPHFHKGFLFLEKVREGGGRALVHCLAGISRSPTLAIAYLMQYMNMSSDDAYRYVKERRANIAPNFNFLGQLLEFERQLKERRAEEASKLSPLSASSSSLSPQAPTPQACTHTAQPQESIVKKKRPCIAPSTSFPAEKKPAKAVPSFFPGGGAGPLRPRSLFPLPAAWAGAKSARLELPRKATKQVPSPTTALARLTFDSVGQLARFPTTSLDKLSFTPCHSAVARRCPPATGESVGVTALPRSRSAVEKLSGQSGQQLQRPPWLSLRHNDNPNPSSSSSRLRSPLTPRKQLTAPTPPDKPAADDEGGRKSRSLEDMLEGLLPSNNPVNCCPPEGTTARRAHLHHSSSSLSSSAASGSQHSSMHSSMEILQVS